MTSRGCIYLCNAIDERTCSDRNILSDSPAATLKVHRLSEAMRSAGMRIIVLSLGRGRQNGSRAWHPARVGRLGKVPVVYLPMLHMPALTHLVSLLWVVPLFARARRRNLATRLLVYNRLPHYVLGLLWARLLGCRCFLDLEDGDAGRAKSWIQRGGAAVAKTFFDWTCSAGSMLANSRMRDQVASQRTVTCYGVAERLDPVQQWQAPRLTVLLGGTLQRTTGVELFIAAVKRLRARREAPPSNLEFVVTGKGDMAPALARLSEETGSPPLSYRGALSRAAYVELLNRAHVGLALKLPSSEIADNTFPSKVIEHAQHGLLVLSTRVSDVPALFGEDGAVFLAGEDPEELADRLAWLAAHRSEAQTIAARGRQRVLHACPRERVGDLLTALLFEQPA